MSAKFLFCLPLRLGVFLFTFFQFVASGIAAGFVWFSVWWLSNGKHGNEPWEGVPKNLQIALYVVGSIYAISSIVGLLGFLGALCKKTGFVRTYYILLCTTFGFQIGSSVWYLVGFFKMRGSSEADCLKNLPEHTFLNKEEYCGTIDQLKKFNPAGVVLSVLAPLFIMAYSIYVVNAYIKRLEKQKSEKEARFARSGGPAYTSVAGGDDDHHDYPYSDKNNAFGGSSAHLYAAGGTGKV